MKRRCYFDQANADLDIAATLSEYLSTTSPTIVCIGSDRCSGDSLGPRVGLWLKEDDDIDAKVHGTIHHPVHAENIYKTLDVIPPTAEIIAIDAGVGQKASIGAIDITTSGLSPGSGVDKDLPHIDGVGISGIVNVSGPLTWKVLHCTRLSIVEKIADVIKAGIKYFLLES